MFSGVAVVATGIAVSSGIVMKTGGPGSASAALGSAQLSQHRHQGQQTAAGDSAAGKVSPVDLADRSRETSRSDRRSPVDPAKKDALSQASGGQVTQTEDLTTQDPRTIAAAMLAQFGFSGSQMSCL